MKKFFRQILPDLYHSYFSISGLKAQETTVNNLFIVKVAAATTKCAPAQPHLWSTSMSVGVPIYGEEGLCSLC